MEIIYADSLFLINLIVNYLVLTATSSICSVPLSRKRLVVASALGAAYVVLIVIPGFGFLAKAPIKLAVAGFMLLAAYGNEGRLGRLCVVFFGVSAALGGVVYAVSMFGGYPIPRNGIVSLRTLVLSFAVSYAALTIVFRHSADRAVRIIERLDIRLGENSVSISALRDTGNQLREPITGRAIAISELDPLMPLFSDKTACALLETAGNATASFEALSNVAEDIGRFQLVPYSAVGVQTGLLLAFRLDKVRINDREQKDILIALSPNRLSEAGEYSAII